MSSDRRMQKLDYYRRSKVYLQEELKAGVLHQHRKAWLAYRLQACEKEIARIEQETP